MFPPALPYGIDIDIDRWQSWDTRSLLAMPHSFWTEAKSDWTVKPFKVKGGVYDTPVRFYLDVGSHQSRFPIERSTPLLVSRYSLHRYGACHVQNPGDKSNTANFRDEIDTSPGKY